MIPNGIYSLGRAELVFLFPKRRHHRRATVYSQARRIGNLIAITQHQREIWTHLYTRPELVRVLAKAVNLKSAPVTDAEELFVNFLILHLNSAYHAMQTGMFMKPEGLQRDIQMFFSLPIPKAVWETTKQFQDEDFVRFVETNRTAN